MFEISQKKGKFFDLFVEASELACKAARQLNDLLKNYENCAIDERIVAIKDTEHVCDKMVHNIVEQINNSFVTPIDREDIMEIIKKMDNITDAIDDTACRFRMLNIKTITDDAIALSELIIQGADELKNVMLQMKYLKKSKALGEKIIEVNRIENEADEIYRKAVTALFSNGMDTLDVIKWKEIYEFLESAIDACEDVANTVEGVVMKNA